MSTEVHAQVMKRISQFFDTKIIQNDWRGIYVELMIAESVDGKNVGKADVSF